MKLKKSLGRKGQSFVEYTLLVVVALIALLSISFVNNLKGGAFTTHFNTVKACIVGG